MGDLQVKLFGGFRLIYDSAPLDTFITPRLQALFAYLILNRGISHFRYQIAYTFWPDSSEAQARTNLRNLIHLLHKALPECDQYIDFGTQTLQWRGDGSYTLDVSEFERLVAPGPGKLSTREALDQAVHLYQGDLLPSCYDDWIIPERERLRHAYISALESLAEMAESNREYRAGLDYTRRLLLAEPLHERGNHQLIRLCALLEDRPAALKTYQAYARLLEHELGIQPDKEIQDLYEFLKNQVGKDASTPKKASRLSLVGRQSEWQKLQATWRNANSGNPQILFLKGEAGIGKTRLVEELIAWSSRQGIRTAVANCYPAEGSLPYAPVVSWLRSRPLPHLDTVWLTEISRLLPELIQKYPKLASPTPLTESWQRLRLFEALARAILANRKPQLLFIEDIHWCDQDTLEWLHYLLRFDVQAPILVVATERSEEIIAPDHPLQVLKTMLADVSSHNEIELKPLGKDECFQLAALAFHTTTNQTLNPLMAENIYQQTEGNPLYIVEMIRLGYPVHDPAHHSNESLLLPEKIQKVLTRRINQITPATRELLSLAATIGREFHLDVLYQASEDDQRKVVYALEELIKRRIIQEISPEVYDFTHDRLRQAAFDGLSVAHRRLLHRKVAEAYLHLDHASQRPRYAETAIHFDLAGLNQQALQYYRLAAESAARIFANTDALHYLQRAVELAEALGVGVPNGILASELAVLLERLGDLLSMSGQFPQAQAALQKALDLHPSAPGIWRSQVYRKISDTLIPQYQHPLAHAALDQAEEALHSDGEMSPLEREEWFQIQIARCQLFYWDNHPDQMDAIIHEVAPLIEKEGGLTQLIQLLEQEYTARLRHERYRVSIETVQIGWRRLALAQELGDPYTMALTQFQLGFGLLWSGDPSAARGWLAKGNHGFTRMGARLWQMRCLAYESIVSRKLNDLLSLQEQAQQLLELSNAMKEYTYQGIAYANQGWLAWQDGDAAKAEKLCIHATKVWKEFGQNVFHGLADWVLLAIAVSRRDPRQIEGALQSLTDPDVSLQPIQEPMASLLVQARSACREKDMETAFSLCEQALEQAKLHHEL